MVFVDEALRGRAYTDSALPIGHGQTISQPYIAARMSELLRVEPGHRILEIGTGTGYQTALLARLAEEVFSIERVPALAERAQANLRELGYRNVRLKVGDGSMGWPDRAPFDGILVAAGAPSIPRPLAEQLGAGGRMILPVGDAHAQILTLVVREEQGLSSTSHDDCVFVRLVGEEGWREEA
jgi:protein-L-isoaspartate(D-aspartate) O-methyltransferase